jgi:hypothetical protein
MNRQAVTGRSIPCLPGRSRSLAAPPPPLLVILRPAAPGRRICVTASPRTKPTRSQSSCPRASVARIAFACVAQALACTEQSEVALRPLGPLWRTSPRRLCSLPLGACPDKVGVGAGLFSGITRTSTHQSHHSPTPERPFTGRLRSLAAPLLPFLSF